MLAFSGSTAVVNTMLTLRTTQTLVSHCRRAGSARGLFGSSVRLCSSPAAGGNDLPLRGIVFDLDGTLTKEGSLDFDEMYRRAGKPASEKNILTWVETLPPEQKLKAKQAIEEVEREGYQRQQLSENCANMLDELQQRPVKLAILTRNSNEGVDIFFDMFGLRNHFHDAYSREWKGGRPKPNPDALIHLSEKWSLAPRQIMMVGDWKDDIDAGVAAGTRTCLKRNPNSKQRNNSHIDNAEHYIQDLMELVPLVDRLV